MGGGGDVHPRSRTLGVGRRERYSASSLHLIGQPAAQLAEVVLVAALVEELGDGELRQRRGADGLGSTEIGSKSVLRARCGNLTQSLMRRDATIQLLRGHWDEIRRFSVRSLALFGSVARDEAGPDSDVDVLVEFERTPALHTYLELKRYLEALLGCPVDLATPGAIPPRKRARIEAELVGVT